MQRFAQAEYCLQALRQGSAVTPGIHKVSLVCHYKTPGMLAGSVGGCEGIADVYVQRLQVQCFGKICAI